MQYYCLYTRLNEIVRAYGNLALLKTKCITSDWPNRSFTNVNFFNQLLLIVSNISYNIADQPHRLVDNGNQEIITCILCQYSFNCRQRIFLISSAEYLIRIIRFSPAAERVYVHGTRDITIFQVYLRVPPIYSVKTNLLRVRKTGGGK